MASEAMPSAPKEKKQKYPGYEDYEIESAARTIQEAEEIKLDKKKMKYVSQCLDAKFAALKQTVGSISDIEEARDAYVAEDED